MVLAAALRAQSTQTTQMSAAAEAMRDFDVEHYVDSIDQELLPKKVTGGVILGGNFSDFIIRQHGGKPVRSNMKVGLEVGGFLDFSVVKHFSIMGQLFFTVEQNRFEIDTVANNRMWNIGIEVPVYFMGRFGNMDKGYVNFGAGPYTHFTVASNVGTPWKNGSEQEPTPEEWERYETERRYDELYKLHNNHFGLGFIVGYEFPFGMQINATYKISLSDIATFYGNHKGEEIANASLYPQKVSLVVAYRFMPKNYYKTIRALRAQRKAAK